MAYINSYKPPTKPILSTKPTNEPYDINFAFPLQVEHLQTSQIELVPFIPSIHAEHFYTESMKTPDIYHYIPLSFPEIETFLVLVEQFRSSSDYILFAVIDKVKLAGGKAERECVAGIIGLVQMSWLTRSVEMGPVIVLPEYRGSHVSTHAIGVLLKYILDLPTAKVPGLGFRRVQWSAHTDNIRSIRCAERMGMKREAHMRWTWCLDEDKEGREVTTEGRGSKKGRDSILLAVCWDDWENGARDHVETLMNRE